MHKLLCIFLAFFFLPSTANVIDYYDSIKKNKHELYNFLKVMPKGSELHYHLAGGAYPETMLALAARGSYCLNPKTFRMTKIERSCDGIESKKLIHMPLLYKKTIEAWSMKNFIASKESGHDHFFNTFDKFIPLIPEYESLLLASIMSHAATQQVQYLEIMVLPDQGYSTTLGALLKPKDDWGRKQEDLLSNQAFQKNITNILKTSHDTINNAYHFMGCKKNPEQKVCKVKVKLLYYVLREQETNNFFAQALTAFVSASLSTDIVGINLVQAEDGPLSLKHYSQQMAVLDFLHKSYPKVHIALHAGELEPKLVKPTHLRFHIKEALYTGHAERIGHGVDIKHEDNMEKILSFMAKKAIPVEINLVSNLKILQISGKKHPLNLYLAHHVPVVLSTDDEGILRTDLTQQYLQAALVHGLDYPTLKQISRNTLTFSFLPGKSLWKDFRLNIPVKACHHDSPACKIFLKKNLKAAMQYQLEKKLATFEKRYAD